VIRGISSNIAFQSALLAHPKFAAGQFNTGFIAEQYPNGFSLALRAGDEPWLLLALAAAAHRRNRERAARISGQLSGHELQLGEEFVIVHTTGDGRLRHTAVKVSNGADAYRIEMDAEVSTLAFSGPLRDIAVHGEFNGQPFSAQIERIGLNYRVVHNGMQIEARVLTPRAAELQALMPLKALPDLSRFLLSPMPGLLVDVAVKAGQAVRAGEKLAVIEAMKMENILVAQQDGVVAKIAAEKGDSLSVDQVILEFE